ncbi:LysR family transcriptional regulator [Burkholderia thailandensis]|uniref:Transcriptional regulator, LysR family n=1 Tax=Burkholderia thailandensis (strain ATCC 700388 / DSM 13276 / CCUG 48851 / CIP 106301 / E264) TaxID=271848 RepID=Q2T100_BURTA|nr:LysR family transcriptional regulator [Burkholderia thailandensis]ABC36804.1 transcriptional regulator, LysR family [Burkholderia thailandensis E264]AHI74321.1 bacterial regulatory helix-turn-helix, lysR family protein [Burkholderia thailandensis 2002721723]AIP24700.1 bacterial regulatory helix-turn-helix, lysR family protein [Burkholderia thailandensis E264]AIS96664.1 bacterial regulatory helix-turn-helix, lysR family protein [Burkholderia thailandensis MSMB59]AJX97721.1 bacterial regulato
MDRLGDIRLFVEAAELGSLSAAGRKLNLTPAAASARLAKLEAQVSTRLFERSTRRLRLTDEGRLYLNCCRQALQALDDADAMLQEGRNVVSGKVRLSSTADFGRNQLLDWLDEFNARYPDVTFSVTASDSSSNLWQDEIDLAIRFAAPPDGALIARPLAANRRVLCASPAFVDKYGTPKDPHDLARFPCNVITVASGPINVWRFTRGGDTQTYTVPLANAHETNDGGFTREWTIRGHGIALKSIWDVARDVRAGRLKVLLPEWRHQDAPLHAIHHSKRYMAPRVRVLLDFLVERFAQEEKALEDLLNACR